MFKKPQATSPKFHCAVKNDCSGYTSPVTENEESFAPTDISILQNPSKKLVKKELVVNERSVDSCSQELSSTSSDGFLKAKQPAKKKLCFEEMNEEIRESIYQKKVERPDISLEDISKEIQVEYNLPRKTATRNVERTLQNSKGRLKKEKKYVKVSDEIKKAICAYAESNPKKKYKEVAEYICAEYKIERTLSRSFICSVLKRKNKTPPNKNRHQILDRALQLWLQVNVPEQDVVSDNMLTIVAKSLGEKTGINDLKYSNSWLQKLKKRIGVNNSVTPSTLAEDGSKDVCVKRLDEKELNSLKESLPDDLISGSFSYEDAKSIDASSKSRHRSGITDQMKQSVFQIRDENRSMTHQNIADKIRDQFNLIHSPARSTICTILNRKEI